MTGPAGETVVLREQAAGQVAYFGAACAGCPLTERCTISPKGRTIHVTAHEAQLQRARLGRQPSWPAGRYSALAGFVEPGETLEAAVVREVEEEAGVVVGAVRYRASQPWPFPASLMLGFQAEYVEGAIRADHDELEDARWFTRAELAEAAGQDPEAWLLLPPRMAIARRLVDAWLADDG